MGLHYSSNWEAARAFLSSAYAADRGTALVFCCAVYQACRGRNAKIHQGEVASFTVLAVTIVENLSILRTFSSQGHWGTTQPHRLSTPLSWRPRPPGWVKFNVDGSLSSYGLAGLGMVARDERGAIVFAAGTSMLHWDPGGVELAAILAPKDLIAPPLDEIRGAIVEVDCQTLMDSCVAGMRREDWSVTVDGNEDFSFLSDFPQIRFQHTAREANRVADFCARFVLRGNFVWLDVDSTPAEFAELVRADLACML